MPYDPRQLPPGYVTPPQPQFVDAATFRQLSAKVDAQNALVGSLQGELAGASEVIRQLKAQNESKLAPKFVEDIPGKRSAYWNVVKVDFDTTIATGTRKSGSVTISQDGPFVWTQLVLLWQVTTKSSATNIAMTNAFAPPTRLPLLISSAALGTVATTFYVDYLDFLVSIRQGGSDRILNSQNEIPSAALFRNDRPEYLGISHWFERSEVITVDATAQVQGTAPDAAARGTLWCCFGGYKILRPIDFAEAFGM